MHLEKQFYFHARYTFHEWPNFEGSSDWNHVRKHTLTETWKTASLFGTLLNFHYQIKLVPQKNLFLLQMMIGLQMKKKWKKLMLFKYLHWKEQLKASEGNTKSYTTANKTGTFNKSLPQYTELIMYWANCELRLAWNKVNICGMTNWTLNWPRKMFKT